MMQIPATPEAQARVEALLLAWKESVEAGNERSPAELCATCPELLLEFERQISAVRKMDALADADSGSRADTGLGQQTGTYGPPGVPEPLPTSVGGYQVLALRGEGGMGRVFEAEDPRLRRRVAVKVMRAQLARDVASRQRFLREAQSAAALQHDNVVPVYQVGEDDGVPFLAMPLLAGESLEDRLVRERVLSADAVQRIARETAAGLAAAHAVGLIHRDIKPGNLWLEAPSGRVKILDFGLARTLAITDNLTDPGAVVGTPAFMSPEQINGEPLDGRSDLFSLGCVLYRAATGNVPFAAGTLTALLRAVAEARPPEPCTVNPAIPRALSDLIVRLMAKRREDRPASADEVAALANGSGVEIPRPRRSFRRLLLAVTLLVPVLGVGGWMLWKPREADEGKPAPVVPVRYRGQIDVLIEREVAPKAWKLVRLDDPRALPMRRDDEFRIVAKVDPPAYVYIVWVEPGKHVTLVYPWDAEKDDSKRPQREEPTGAVSLPPVAGTFYKAEDAKPGVVTMVVLARPTPLDVADEVVRGWFTGLPVLPLPPGGERGVVWFDDYQAVDERDRPRAFKVAGAADPFARWQGLLQKAVGDRAAFQTAVSFARAGGK